MNKFILTLFFIWIVWKVLKSAIEELQQRMEGRMEGEEEKTRRAPDRAGRSPTAPRQPVSASRREPESWELGQAIPGQEEDELERWFSEAIDRKRQLGEPARPQAARPRTAPRRVEPRTEHRREARVEQRRVARPREPVAARPARKRWKAPPAAPKPRKFKKAPKRGVREKSGMAELVGTGEWDMDDIRRGVIIAEILGPPKGLGDIDSHVI